MKAIYKPILKNWLTQVVGLPGLLESAKRIGSRKDRGGRYVLFTIALTGTVFPIKVYSFGEVQGEALAKFVTEMVDITDPSRLTNFDLLD